MNMKKLVMGIAAFGIGAFAFKHFETTQSPTSEEKEGEEHGCGCTGDSEAYESEYS